MNPSSRTIASTSDCSRRSFDELPEGMRHRAYAEVTTEREQSRHDKNAPPRRPRRASGLVIVVDLTRTGVFRGPPLKVDDDLSWHFDPAQIFREFVTLRPALARFEFQAIGGGLHAGSITIG